MFFTEGVSLKLWVERGLLDREKLIYEEILKNKVFDKIYFFTYGTDDRKYVHLLPKEIVVIPKPKFFPSRLGSVLYSFFLPIIQKKYLKKCSIYKTNQMKGSWSAVFSKNKFAKPLLLRTGFTSSNYYYQEKNYFMSNYYSLWEKFAYRNADYSIVSSFADKEYLVKTLGENNIDVLHNFIDINLFKPAKTSKKKEIIFVGRLCKEKNLLALIRAISKTDFSLDIYGEGNLKEELKELVENLNLQNRVTFKGVVPNKELPKILNQYKVYILPSFHEGMPKTLLEAMSCGSACIGTNVSGTREVIKNRENGLLVETDELSLFKGINLLMKNNSLRNKLGKKARKTIESEFSLKKIFEKERKIYEQLI